LADVAVVGAGLGGLATAARLAKLGHRVTVCERGDAPGGLLGRLHHDGMAWDATPMQTTIPAVLRDLFRKSGRPLERYVDLELSTPARRHVFADGTTLDLPTGSRGGQLDAVSDTLGAAAGQEWTRFVDGQADLWALLRNDVLDPTDGAAALAGRRLSRALRLKQSLHRLLRKTFEDERLRELAAFPSTRDGNAAVAPACRAVDSYVERLFGVWRAPGGASDLARALMQRMEERAVDVRFGAEVASLALGPGGVTGLRLTEGSALEADVVVTSVSPAQVFSRLLEHPRSRDAVRLFTTTSARAASTVTHLGLSGEPPAMPAEVVLHGDPVVTVATGSATGGQRSDAWTITSSGPLHGDVLDVMAQRGVDVRGLVTTRLERCHRADPGWGNAHQAAARAALARPLAGLHCLGTSLVLGSSIPYVAWQAAHVAEVVGKA
jgi:UDP-galactopyranose mutase